MVEQVEPLTDNKIFSTIHPNPIDAEAEYFFLQVSSLPLNFNLFDLTGKNILQIKIFNFQDRIKLNGLQRGIYLYQLNDNLNKKKYGKIVVK